MNYADMKLGTWYPMGGMYKVIEAFVAIGKENGVTFHTSSPVDKISIEGKKANGILVNGSLRHFDYIVAGADYHHVDSSLIPKSKSNYDNQYWQSRTMAPSSLLFYIGINKKIEGLLHHNLFFDKDFTLHGEEIYTTHQWPQQPLFYVCVPSKTDASVAPEGHENMFILMPISTELEGDTEEVRKNYFEMILQRLKEVKGIEIKGNIVHYRSFCISDFKNDYNAFKGNAYGLANTLKQTAILKPKLKSDHLENLYYTGQLTLPGPGMPPAIISGQLVASLIIKNDSNG